jgi:hypothetical protein
VKKLQTSPDCGLIFNKQNDFFFAKDPRFTVSGPSTRPIQRLGKTRDVAMLPDLLAVRQSYIEISSFEGTTWQKISVIITYVIANV